MPLAGFLVGTLIAYPSLTIPTLGHPVPGLVVPPLVGMALGIGIGVAISLLIVGNVRTTTAVRQAEAAELDRMRAELLALRAQINPHFFFNALNTIRYFVRSEPVKARALLLDLSQMFQRILRAGDFVPLENELAHVEAYLSLEVARLGERLHYEKEVTDEALLVALVPTLILQPLVENAVIHGIASRRTGGTIRLQVRPVGEDILIEVTDDGVGMAAECLEEILDDETPSTSIGLRNVDRRLRVAYGPAYGLLITSQPGEGTHAVVRVPRKGKTQAQQRIRMDERQEGNKG
jgi:sensor histidine kinase YesM